MKKFTLTTVKKYQHGRRPVRKMAVQAVLVLVAVPSVYFGASALWTFAFGATTQPGLTLEGYIFENADGSTADGNSQLAAANTNLTGVKKGESLVLRTQLSNNTADSMGSDLALFYDKGDGVWNKVGSNTVKSDSSGTGCDISSWACETIETTGDIGRHPVSFVGPDGILRFIYADWTNFVLRMATFVGEGGTGCSGGNTRWTCHTIISEFAIHPSVAVAPNGTTWIAYHDSARLKVIRATDLSSNCSGTMTCWTVDQTVADTGDWSSISFDPNDGSAWISYQDQTNGNLRLTHYVGSGGSGCSHAAWSCQTVDTGGTDVVGGKSSTIFDSSGEQLITYFNDTDQTMIAARYVTSGGTGCSNAAWSCVVMDTIGANILENSTQLNNSGNAVSAYDGYLAEYVGSGGSGCDTNQWDGCGNEYSLAYSDLAYGPNGPWLSGLVNGGDLAVMQYVGSGGTGCTSSAWNCVEIETTGDTGYDTSLTFDSTGLPTVAFYNGTDSSLMAARYVDKGDIVLSRQTGVVNEATISESHSDMTSTTDTANRDDADCIGGGNWNNGKFSSSENISGVTLPDGSGTKQCTEVAWVIDTSQAQYGQTYRFVVASEDGWRFDKGRWRGPVSLTPSTYPTITIGNAAESTTRYSKDNLGGFSASCPGNSDWGCLTIDDTNTDVGRQPSLAFGPDGTPWISYFDATNGVLNLRVAQYVGSGGNCDAVGNGSDAWNCTTVDADNRTGEYSSLAFHPDGTPWISYYEGTSEFNLKVARYVGSGGNCDTTGGSDAWQCTRVDVNGDVGQYSSLAFDQTGTAWVSYYDNTNGNIKVARYVGSNGSGCTLGSTEWTCTIIQSGNNVGQYNSLAISPDGVPWISFFGGNDLILRFARYVGSGGNCDSTNEWSCGIVDNGSSTGTYSSIAFDPSGDPWISYFYTTGADLRVAQYVSTGGNCGSGLWQCTTVEGTNNAGQQTSLAFDATGSATVAHYDSTAGAIELVTHVGSGGSCASAGGSSAWECSTIRTGGLELSLAYSPSGEPWVSYFDNSANNLAVARLKLPENPLNSSFTNNFSSRNAGNSDYRYSLTPGFIAQQNDTCPNGVADRYGYCGLLFAEGNTDSITAQIYERPIYGLATRFNSNTQLPAAKVHFQTSVSPSTNNVILQVYRFGTTNAWETVTTYNNAGCSGTNCYIEAQPNGTITEYFETDSETGEYWVYYRIYQVESTSTSITFELDSFQAVQTGSQLRDGQSFTNQRSNDLRW